MRQFVSLDTFEFDDRRCYVVENPEQCDTFDHLLGACYIDGIPRNVLGVERHAKMPPFRKGEYISLATLIHDDDEPAAMPSHPVLAPGVEWTWYLDERTIKVWVEFNEDFEVELLSFVNDIRNSPVAVIEDCGVMDLMGVHRWPDREGGLRLALELGVTYRQPFLVEMYASHYCSNTESGPEWDCDTSWDLIHVTPLSSDETLWRLSEWLDRTNE